MRASARLPVATLAATASIVLAVASAPAQEAPPPATEAASQGRTLYEEGCSSCHGFDAAGIEDRGPSLRGAGAAAADFYLRTGRMPLSEPRQEPRRADPAYGEGEIDALVAYLGSLGGPEIPSVDPSSGSVSEGQELYTSSCSGCHAISGQGGVVVGGQAPRLTDASPTEIAEAIRVGPYLMPAFGRKQLSDRDVDSIARYVDEVVDHPDDRGGWGIGHIGPVPEGMIAWFLAAIALVLVARVIGERNEDPS